MIYQDCRQAVGNLLEIRFLFRDFFDQYIMLHHQPNPAAWTTSVTDLFFKPSEPLDDIRADPLAQFQFRRSFRQCLLGSFKWYIEILPSALSGDMESYRVLTNTFVDECPQVLVALTNLLIEFVVYCIILQSGFGQLFIHYNISENHIIATYKL